MKNICTKIGLLHIFLILLNGLAYGQSYTNEEPDFLEPTEAYQPTPSIKDNKLSIAWHIEKGYFLYRHGFKILAKNENKHITLPLQIDQGVKKYDEFFDKEVEIYHDKAMIQTDISALLGKTIELTLVSQGCADKGLCFPPTDYTFHIDQNGLISSTNGISIALTSSIDDPITHAKTTTSLLLTLIGAFFGGLILNLMPCVFPVLSLKALSFTSGHTSAQEQHQHGWSYTLGVTGSFLVAASIILIARATGESLGWGFQLQHPVFVTLMVYLFFVMGLSLSGFVEFGGSFMGAGQNLTTGNSLKSSFFTGVLAALVASPCTAPFMATALGVALTQPIHISLLIFATLGLGMAFPFLLLSYSPGLAHFMPKPGAWMVTFKQALAFPLYLTAIWLLWVLSHQSGSNIVIVTLLGILLITLSVWVLKLPTKSRVARVTLKILALLCLVPAGLIALDATSNEQGSISSEQTAFSLNRLNEYRQQGTPIFVDLTADWCLTCKVNEHVALTERVKNALANSGAILIVGDWTNQNPDIETLLKTHQRSGIPLYLMYPKGGGEAEVLPQLLTEQIVLDAIERAVN